MKQFRFFLLACGLAVLALSLLTSAQAEARQATAKVRAIRGTAQVSANGGGWATLKVNDILKAGSVIKTGPESTVDLFVNNSVVRVTPETTMGLDKIAINETGTENVTETQLNLKSGRIIGNVKKLASASRYEIKTPTGVAGIRGTDFDITVTPLGNGLYKFVVTSISGTIVGSGSNSQGVIRTAVVNTGETWSPDDDLVQLLPAPVLAGLKTIIDELAATASPVPLPAVQTVINVDADASQSAP